MRMIMNLLFNKNKLKQKERLRILRKLIMRRLQELQGFEPKNSKKLMMITTLQKFKLMKNIKRQKMRSILHMHRSQQMQRPYIKMLRTRFKSIMKIPQRKSMPLTQQLSLKLRRDTHLSLNKQQLKKLKETIIWMVLMMKMIMQTQSLDTLQSKKKLNL